MLEQSRVQETGQRIFQLLESENQSIFNKDWWYGRIMEWSMKNEDFKVRMFRFVDVLPYLSSSDEVAQHLKEYFTQNGGELPKVFGFGLGLGGLAPGLLAGAVKKNVTQMAKMFIAGESPQEALPLLKKSRKNGMTFTIDLLGEVTLSEKEAQSYQDQYIQLIEWLANDSRSWEISPLLDSDHLGPIPKVNVSVKISTLYSQISVEDWDHSVEILKERLRPILLSAVKNQVFVNIDMEHYDIKNLTLDIFKQILMEPEFKNYPYFGLVIQAYLRDSLQDLQSLIEFAKQRGTIFSIRLVKGAYWDYETIISEQRGWPCPVFQNKKETDINYESCLEVLIKNHKFIKTAIASHNVRSLAVALVLAETYGLPPNGIELQMLYGMADAIKKAIVKMGYRVREYTPVGELIPGMAYLVRRLLENTSNESFLRSKFAENVSVEELLSPPQNHLQVETQPKQTYTFQNEPLLDFKDPTTRQQFQTFLNQLRQQKPKTYPIIIDGQKITTEETHPSLNPSHPQEILGYVNYASIPHAEKALEICKRGFTKWKLTPISKRAELLNRLADKIREHRFELAALEVLEVGKTWHEADGDITEAIDFCNYYANNMKNLDLPIRMGHVPGELSLYHYQPRGVSVVIAPWNFPLAILTGMTVASLVAGNTVIMKPAEQSSVIAARLMEFMLEVGFPTDVIQFLPGQGEIIGEYLVQHKDTSLIVFTGSKTVGLQILEKSSRLAPKQHHLKKCIIEMGGKNAVIIDSDADLDEAVDGVLYSAFGFQGQKCSACSRVIVLDEIYDRFVNRFVEAARSIHIDYAENPGTYVGPLIDEESQRRVLKAIEHGQTKAKIIFQGKTPTEGYFVPPTIFIDVDTTDDLAQKEFFAPVVAVIRANNLEQAIRIANNTEYALTGGIFSRSPANIEKIKSELEVGNLYINRAITGAMVERHPFGGFKLSGIGSKAGGPDYLLQFLEPRSIVENTLRRGFAPGESQSNNNAN